MAALKWILEDNGKVLRADVEGMGVVLTVTPVDQPAVSKQRVSEAFVKEIGWPTKSTKFQVSGYHATGTLDDAKKNSLRAFMTWARSVITIATSDGWGNITIDLGDKNEW